MSRVPSLFRRTVKAIRAAKQLVKQSVPPDKATRELRTG
jgi:hypothetical protein